jgi:hypothetical protein
MERPKLRLGLRLPKREEGKMPMIRGDFTMPACAYARAQKQTYNDTQKERKTN